MIKELCLFSGYGGSVYALTKAGIEHKVIAYSDIDKGANYIFALNHGKDIPQLGDITKINTNELEDFDLLTGGFPCQSFSIAGNRKGFLEKNKGLLFFEIIRIAEAKKPRWMLLENVQGLLSHDKGKTFKIIIEELINIGYKVHWKLLKSKDHGTPQNRPRVWLACFREQEDYDKFMFPETEELKITVKDLLMPEVDEKYYLSGKQLERINDHTKKHEEKGNGFSTTPIDLFNSSKTLTSHMKKDIINIPYFQVAEPTIVNMQQRSDERPSIQKALAEGKPVPGGSGTLSRDDGIAYTVDTSSSQAVNVGTLRTHKDGEGFREIKDSTCPTIPARAREDGSGQPIINATNNWRRLSPRECFRLMGFFDDEIKFGDLKDSKLYFLAGNGWEINTASKIFKQMFKGNSNTQRGLAEYE